MTWLAHHEFGADHRPFVFDGKKDKKSDGSEDTESVWEKLSEKVNLAPYTETISFSKSYHPINESLPRDLMLESHKIYKKLMAESI